MLLHIYQMNYRCERCNRTMSSKERLKSHIKRKRRCPLVEGNAEISVEQMLINVDNRYTRLQVQQIRIVDKGFDEVDSLLKKEDIPKFKNFSPRTPRQCLKLIQKIMKKYPQKKFILPVNNTSQLKIKVKKEWVNMPLRIVFSKIFIKYINNPLVNDFHPDHYPNHPGTPYVYKTFLTVLNWSDCYINSEMRLYFGAKRFQNYKTVAEKKKIKEMEALELLKQENIKILKKQEKERLKIKIEQRIQFDKEKRKNAINNAMKQMEKELTLKSDWSKENIAYLINTEIVDNANNIKDYIWEQIQNLNKKDYYYCIDSYNETYDSDLLKEL